ncbi:uncharacterized protein L969DRAFT_18307 [Mixia osmundae IAM 14324]|uniref:Uncharacterized protein n=1 Tax=Mixia osmundae (strain CBS 9802 / IAM 14324 / JCM 22182 / KY 12970) TaxID=764103 RepID=G7DZ75_MIXOS|nr:uncharacterized protein L969DRAFT_18307 [Mixia osmundae IAM 14324]KEI38287.1 hypothetical protein L969DRAFT_18307 [Mixia osmundae IAM 14324]GAA95885.1 hypothetical protein E5Q_02543 [Mixia osmundae IAM 14324]
MMQTIGRLGRLRAYPVSAIVPSTSTLQGHRIVLPPAQADLPPLRERTSTRLIAKAYERAGLPSTEELMLLDENAAIERARSDERVLPPNLRIERYVPKQQKHKHFDRSQFELLRKLERE